MKRGKLLTLLLAGTLIITSCAKKDCCAPSQDLNGEISPQTSLILSVKDSDGKDLLNPNNAGAFSEKNISLEHILANGVRKVVYDEKSNKIKIIKRPDSDFYILVFECNRVLINSKSSTIIKWNETTTDTISAEFSKNSQVQRLWLNNELFWHHLAASSLPPTLIK